MVIPEIVKKILPREKLKVIAIESSTGKVKWRARRCSRLEDYVNLDFSPSGFFPFPWISISPSQAKEEITELLKIVAKREPRFILGMGTTMWGHCFCSQGFQV